MKLPNFRSLPVRLLILILLTAGLCSAQPSVRKVRIQFTGEDRPEGRRFFTEDFTGDSLSCIRYLEQGLSELRTQGYLEASVDTLLAVQDTLVAYTYVGKRYGKVELSRGNVPDDLVPTGMRKSAVLYDTRQAAALLDDLLKNCEDIGHPFAAVRLDSIRTTPEGVAAVIRLDTGKVVRIDSIRIHGPSVVAPVFLYDYLSIEPGDLYRESLVRRVDARLLELPFLTSVRPSGVLFAEHYTRLDLFLDSRKASQFDGVIGLLQSADGGKAQLTGEAHLKLQNSFKRGEVLEFDWKQLPPRSQDLKIHLRYPFLFNTPIGVDGFLKLYRRDTLFVDVEKNIGAVFSLKGNNYLKVFLSGKSSDLQSTAGLESVTVLPAYADVSVTGYGASLQLEDLDYRLNPRKGYWLEFSGSVGNRDIRRNSGINPAAYEGVRLQSTQYQSLLGIRIFLPIKGRSVAMLENRSAFIAGSSLFSNELFRIGGLRSLRGFDEESIFASAYTMTTVEYRYQTAMNSYLSGFFNIARYENNSQEIYYSDTPWGIGTGYTFQTRLGILSISYALGRQEGLPLMIRNGKVHFGIVNYF